jgi:ribosomal protein S18 acetylase RimI-like enzyme
LKQEHRRPSEAEPDLTQEPKMRDDLTAVTERDTALRSATIETLVAAFRSDAAARALYPADEDYRRHFPGFLDAFGGRAFEGGVVDRDPAGLAAALWFPPGLEPDGDAIMSAIASSVPAGRLEKLAVGMEIQAGMHPHAPHWYLPWIGVRPEAQGAGLGSRLLRQGLARVDAAGMPAYLEATNRRNAALYARHGFEAVGVVTSPGYPEIIPMWRPAGTAAGR